MIKGRLGDADFVVSGSAMRVTLTAATDEVGGALLSAGAASHQSDFAGDSYTNLPPSLESKKLVNVGLAA